MNPAGHGICHYDGCLGSEVLDLVNVERSMIDEGIRFCRGLRDLRVRIAERVGAHLLLEHCIVLLVDLWVRSMVRWFGMDHSRLVWIESWYDP